jgi:hypothetical protein
MEVGMAVHDIIVVSFVVGMFSLFAVALAFASWDESRRQ